MSSNEIDKLAALPTYDNMKYIALKNSPGCVDLFNTLMSRITTELARIYHPKIPFSLEVNLTKETKVIDDNRMKDIFIECIVDSMRFLGWQVVTGIRDLEGNEMIHIQKHKGVA